MLLPSKAKPAWLLDPLAGLDWAPRLIPIDLGAASGVVRHVTSAGGIARGRHMTVQRAGVAPLNFVILLACPILARA